MKIINVKTEYMINPIGIGTPSPRIFWKEEGIEKQDAFQILYTVNGVPKQTEIIKSRNMYYDFSESFCSRDRIAFTVKVFSDEQEITSEENSFEIGLLAESDWKARWITGAYTPHKHQRYPVDCFKKVFRAEDVVQARLYITSRGLYTAYINGQRASNFVLAPGSTDYRKRIQYQTYDVTDLLRNGGNTMTIELADGWYRGSIGAKGFCYVFGKETALLCQAELTDKFGCVRYVVSDDTFLWSNDGKIRFADLKDGETVDNTREPSYSGRAKISKNQKSVLSASDNVFVEEHECFSPIKKTLSPSGKQIFEFPQNLAGIIDFEVTAKQGQRIDIVLGEMTDENGEVTLRNVQCVRKGKKTPLQEIHFICKDGKNGYRSKFMIAGFKYASVGGDVDFSVGDIRQIAVYSSLQETSSFKCSESLVNIFYKNTLWSLKSNSADVPTDCPTRERMGWTGDSQVFFNTASYLTEYAPFAEKHIRDVFDRQDKNGRLPQIAPYNAEDWFMDVMNGSVGWADVGVLIPYRFYLKYNDDRLLKKYFDRILLYAEFMIRRCGRAKGVYAFYAKPLHLSKANRKFGVNSGQSYGEWAEPNDVKPVSWLDFCQPHPEESMAYTVFILETVQKICSIVGREERIDRLRFFSEGIKTAYRELVAQKEHTLDTNRQAKLVRPLYMRLLTDEQTEFAKKRLIQALDFYGWRLGTGFLSTPFILDVLSDIDVKYAYRLLLNEEMPGWLYMAKNDTGTVWEGWEGPNAQRGISSLNHYSKGAMVEWLFHGMCGINVLPNNRFFICPKVGAQLSYAKCAYQSIYGTVTSAWERNGTKVVYRITVPSNTEATVLIDGKTLEISSGSYEYEVEI